MEHPVYSFIFCREGDGWCLHAGVQEGREREREWLRVRISPFLHAGTIITIVNFARSESTRTPCTCGGNEKQAAPVTLLHTGSPTLGGGSAFVAWIHGLPSVWARTIDKIVGYVVVCPPCASGYASTRSLC